GPRRDYAHRWRPAAQQHRAVSLHSLHHRARRHLSTAELSVHTRSARHVRTILGRNTALSVQLRAKGLVVLPGAATGYLAEHGIVLAVRHDLRRQRHHDVWLAGPARPRRRPCRSGAWVEPLRSRAGRWHRDGDADDGSDRAAPASRELSQRQWQPARGDQWHLGDGPRRKSDVRHDESGGHDGAEHHWPLRQQPAAQQYPAVPGVELLRRAPGHLSAAAVALRREDILYG